MDRTVAAFDFDGTLTRRDTLLPFLARVSGVGALGRALAKTAPNARDRDAAKERLLQRLMRGREYQPLVDAGLAYGERLARESITTAMRERLAWHQREGHEIVIVSASLNLYVDPAARVLAVDHTLCTVLAVDDDKCTGALLGANCRGAEKAARLRTYLGSDDVELWAYGNSTGDRELLELANHPVWVKRGRVR